MWSSPSPKIHPKNPYLHVEWCAQNVYWKLAEDLGLPKEARKPPHYLAEQRKNGKEREREEKQRNQDGTSTTKRKLSKKKGIWTLEGHPKDWKISRDGGGASKYQKKTQHTEACLRRAVPPSLHTRAWDTWAGLGTEEREGAQVQEEDQGLLCRNSLRD